MAIEDRVASRADLDSVLTGADRLGFEECTVVPSATPARRESLQGSVHVSMCPPNPFARVSDSGHRRL